MNMNKQFRELERIIQLESNPIWREERDKELAIAFWRDHFYMTERICLKSFEDIIGLILQGRMKKVLPMSLRQYMYKENNEPCY